MVFRVLIIGGHHRVEYARLRDTLDKLLANRLPDVEILTAGGPGVPALAACYAAERKFPLTTSPLDYSMHRGDAEEWRNGRLVEMADAAVLVGAASWEFRDLLDRAAAKGLRIVVVGARSRRSEASETAEEDDRSRMVRGLPD